MFTLSVFHGGVEALHVAFRRYPSNFLFFLSMFFRPWIISLWFLGQLWKFLILLASAVHIFIFLADKWCFVLCMTWPFLCIDGRRCLQTSSEEVCLCLRCLISTLGKLIEAYVLLVTVIWKQLVILQHYWLWIAFFHQNKCTSMKR